MSCTAKFKDNACNEFMWLHAWLINWRRDDASPFLTWVILHKRLACIMAINRCCNVVPLVARQKESFRLLFVNCLLDL